MTVSVSAVTWDQTMPYIPKRALSRNSMGMLNASQRMTHKKTTRGPRYHIWVVGAANKESVGHVCRSVR